MAGNAKTAINPDTKAVRMVFFMAGFLQTSQSVLSG